MFQKRSEDFARVTGCRHVGFESLESRRLLSAAPTYAGVAESVLPAATVKAAVLGPSAVEGRYKGDVTETDGTEVEVKIIVTSTRAELIVAGATLSETLTSAHLISIRKGVFDVKFTKGSEFVTVVGTVGKSGLKFSGTYSTSTGASGTFAVKKYADS